jgi:putative N6-adenine-specific DNA methylase
MKKYNFIATTGFGLEATVKREVTRLGFENIKVLDGRVDFTGTIDAIPKANIWLRSAERIRLNMGEFVAESFEELFEQTKSLPWEEWIGEDAKFTVTGKSIKSTLFSVPDCQAIVKKAIVEKLKLTYTDVDWFMETGAMYKVQVAILKDKVTLSIDTTGAGLHKRGYREVSMIAPLKETLASAMIELSYWKKDRILLDPVCGSGTIAIEAALIAKNIAPGLNRSFVSEDWPQIGSQIWEGFRTDAYSKINKDFTPQIFASDIDERAIELAKYNARVAGVDDCITFEVKSLSDITLPGDYGVVICNPPYGERLGQLWEVEDLYRDMGDLFSHNSTWSVYVITSYEEFETLYGGRADAKRKLFNGMIKTDYYQYHGVKPKRK